MYSVDDLVVYPAQGVGKINGIDSKLMGGAHCDFYSVRIQHSNITLIVPVKNAQNVGLRRLVTKDSMLCATARRRPSTSARTGTAASGSTRTR